MTPDGSRIAVAGSGTISIYDPGTGYRKTLAVSGHRIDFFPDGIHLLIGEGTKEDVASPYIDCRSRIWNTETDKAEITFEGFKVPVDSIALSATGKYVACGGRSGQLVLWERQS